MAMNASGEAKFADASLQGWFSALRAGGETATQKLWHLYFGRMVRVARRKLRGGNRTVADEEDIALSALKSFCLGFQQGRFQERGSDGNLWPLLATLTLNKAIEHLRRESRQKRGGGRPAVSAWAAGLTQQDLVQRLIASEPAPEVAVATAESFEQLLRELDDTGDPALHRIALATLEGASAADVAADLGCTVRTVQRKLRTIRAVWEAGNP